MWEGRIPKLMERRYYEILRNATQEEYYEAINSPDHELYDVLWDLFETVVIEPAEVFDPDFNNHNQFRYSINSEVTLEFFPDSDYFAKRFEPNPYRDGTDAAGIHLKFSILPERSCLFSVGLQIWGRSERLAFKKLWKQHRPLLRDLLRRSKPMVSKRIPFPAMDYSSNLDEMLDNYFAVRDSENFLELQYAFAQLDETESAYNYMVYMGLLYHAIRAHCQDRENRVEQLAQRLREFFAGPLPDLAHPLPSVEMTITSDTG